MPILSLKDNPPSKPFKNSLLDYQGTWWIAKVKPRQEKSFAFDLINDGIDYYLPYYENRIKRSDGKVRKSYLVLFPSYVSFTSEDPYRLLVSHKVVTIIPIKAQRQFHNQLSYIDSLNETGCQIFPQDTPDVNYFAGENVKVNSGPCKGLTGRIVKINKNGYLIINIDVLGCALVHISGIQVEPVLYQN